MASPRYKRWLVLRWTSKLGRCLTRQSKRSCSEAMTRRLSAISLRLGYVRGVPQKNVESSMNEVNGVSLRRGCDTLTQDEKKRRVKGITLRELMTRGPGKIQLSQV